MATRQMAESALFNLPASGYLTLQIPQIVISFGRPADPEPVVELPEEWFTELTGNLPSPRGFTHWTRAGYNANKEKIKAAFESAGRRRRGTWEDFERKAEEHFQKIETTIAKTVAAAEKKIRRLREYVV